MSCAKNTIRFINPLTSSLLLKLNFKDLLTTLVSDLDQDLLSVTNDEGIDDALGIAERRIGTEERLFRSLTSPGAKPQLQ